MPDEELHAPQSQGGHPFKTGAKLSPRHKLAAAEPYHPPTSPPAAFFLVPKEMRVWGNNQYGDCVSAEEAFAKDCHNPPILVDDEVVIEWARKHGVLNGAMLDDVLDKMSSDGYKVGSQQYNDGGKRSVDWSKPDLLRAAIADPQARGPVKIAMGSGSLPSGAGKANGWYAFGNKGRHSSDHCTSLCGYGTAKQCFDALNVPLPSGVDPNKADCFLHFTWGTIGVVDHAWIMSTCEEAWTRLPTTVGVPPLPPEPGPGPTPPGPEPIPPGPQTHIHMHGHTLGFLPWSGEGWVHPHPAPEAAALPDWAKQLIRWGIQLLLNYLNLQSGGKHAPPSPATPARPATDQPAREG